MGAHRLGGNRLDRAAVASIGAQPSDQQVDPLIDDVGHLQTAGQKSAQQLLDGRPGAIDELWIRTRDRLASARKS